MTPGAVKTEALKMIDQLPEAATWQDLMHKIYVRLAIENGLADSQAEKTVAVSEIRAKYGLKN